jgi:hypothetical protein
VGSAAGRSQLYAGHGYKRKNLALRNHNQRGEGRPSNPVDGGGVSERLNGQVRGTTSVRRQQQQQVKKLGTLLKVLRTSRPTEAM